VVAEAYEAYAMMFAFCFCSADSPAVLEPRSATGKPPSLSITSQAEADQYITALEKGSADIETLQLVARSCMTVSSDNNPLMSSDASGAGIWHKSKNGGRLIDGLLAYLAPSKASYTLYLILLNSSIDDVRLA
jgi:hypothetical protein